MDGRGVAQSDVEAAHWFRKAANQGDALAQFELVHFFSFGKRREEERWGGGEVVQKVC